MIASLFSLVVLSALGFQTDVDKTLSTARKDGKPIVISFFGIWCPPCNELEETVFETPAFHDKAKAFHLLKVDADAEASWKLKDKYKVGGYPTVVFTDAKGGEIYRIVGYRSQPEFLRVMDLVLSAKGKDLNKACRSGDTEDLWRCALVCTERADKKCANAAYKKLEKKLKPGTFRYLQARAYAVDNSETKDLKRDGYERLLKEAPDSPQAMLWALDYLKLFEAGTKPAPKKEILEAVLANSEKMKGDPRAMEAGIPPTDVVQIRAILLDHLGKKDEAKAAWKEAAGMLERLASELPKGAPARGFTLERIGALEEAGEVDAALKLANDYRVRFPKEFTFHYRTASILEGAKRYNEALPIAQQAYAASYGDNRIRSATLLVKLYTTVPDKESARKVYEETTKGIRPDTKLEVRTHRHLKSLEEAWKKLEAMTKAS